VIGGPSARWSRPTATAVRRTLLVAGLLVPGLATSPALASEARRVVVDYLVATYGSDNLPPASDKDYRVIEVDLNGDGEREIVAYVETRDFCGSGGCKLLVLQRRPTGPKAIMDTTIIRAPIRMLSSSSHGWRDIGVWVGGGGLKPHEVALKFDGTRYPRNSSMSPVRPVKIGARGRVLISAKR